jgi:hypothetical protein
MPLGGRDAVPGGPSPEASSPPGKTPFAVWPPAGDRVASTSANVHEYECVTTC